MSRKRLVIGNWKMHGSMEQVASLTAAVREGAAKLIDADVLILPPFPYLLQVAELSRGSKLGFGAQNLATHKEGAYTGEVSAAMLSDIGCSHVLVGHSERRTLYAEDNATVVAKLSQALDHDLTPILCLGETLAEREAKQTGQVISNQLNAVIEGLGWKALDKMIIAYEPVWAIGTGKTASPKQAQTVHTFIRSQVAQHDAIIAQSLRILYGGSVKGENANALFTQPDIDGGLIGGASLEPEQFLNICRA